LATGLCLHPWENSAPPDLLTKGVWARENGRGEKEKGYGSMEDGRGGEGEEDKGTRRGKGKRRENVPPAPLAQGPALAKGHRLFWDIGAYIVHGVR